MLLLGFSMPLWARAFEGRTGGNVAISNQAAATYNDEAGSTYTTVSPIVTVTVMAVAGVTVTPDETTPSETVAPREQITRVFRVCNTGNTTETYTLTQSNISAPATFEALYYDIDGSATLTSGDVAITLNQTATPQLAPGSCVGVLAVVNTNDSAPQSTLAISINASSNSTGAANGRVQDAGSIINSVGNGAHLTDPTNPSLAPAKLVNGVTEAVVNTGSPFTYTISFRNSGDTAARDVVMSDQLNPALEYIAGSLRLNDQSLSDAVDADAGSITNGTIEIHLTRAEPGETFRITFIARLAHPVPPGTGVVNTANFAATNAPPVHSSDATVVVDPFGLVYAARGGSSAAIAGARIELFKDADGGSLLNLPTDSGYTPNASNANPFPTDASGHFSFKPAPDQIGLDDTEANYFMRISAAGFLTRMIQLKLRRLAATRFALTMHALDGQALADSSFNLLSEDLRITELAALVMNIPMFEPNGLQILKSADRARAEVGDLVTYRVEVRNPTTGILSNVTVEDRLPESFHYATGSALLSIGSSGAQPIEPEVQGSTLIFKLGDLEAGATAQLVYRLRIGVNAAEGAQDNLAVASGLFPSGDRTQTAPARATVFVVQGIFSTKQVLVGRVFVDANHNNQFDDGDRPAPGVRLYLNNGQSVITDSAGLYNFPSMGDGPQVISIDPVTVPSHYTLSDAGRLSGKSWTRLLRTPIGGGALLRQNFALLEEPGTNGSASPAPSPANGSAMPAPAVSSQPDPSTDKPKQPVAPGTYEFTSTETIEAVPVGTVRVLSPKPDQVWMTPALQIDAQVELNSTVKVELNGEGVSDKNIGVRTLDRKNQVASFTFVGLNLRPGPNRLRITPVKADGSPGKSEDMIVLGRGPAHHLEIVAEKTEIQAGGGDSTVVKVKAFDEWNNPAFDGDIGVETSLGELSRIEAPQQANQKVTDPAERNSPHAPLVLKLEQGEIVLRLTSSGAPGEAHLRATSGTAETQAMVRVTAEMRARILVGMAEMSFGPGIPEVGLRREEGNFRSRLSFFYSGRLFGDSMVTLSYDSQRPINRTAGRDRLFQLDPNERVYPLFGDSSTRFEAAQTNSKLYARIDYKRSYAMFGDFQTEMNAPLMGYDRNLTGVKVHLENSQGDGITLTGARPDTAFARDVFPAGNLGILQLTHGEILPGSENVLLEIRDRRNPDVIVSTETMTRSVDYNLDPLTGQIFFLRYISTFDYLLNLTQIVVSYEHRATGMNSAVYTARAHKNFKSIGLKVGLSAALQTEASEGNFFLGGVDVEKKLPRGGTVQFAFARSQGELVGGGNFFNSNETTHDGSAYLVTLSQPLPFRNATLRGRFASASEGFFNPYGGTVTPGSRRSEIMLDLKPLAHSTLRLGFGTEQNKTENVDNSRLTFSAAWDQVLHERVRLHLGFDHRAFNDDLNGKQVDSNLITAGAEVQVTEKLRLSVKREQNLGEADPTYPDQTTLGASYQMSSLTRLFFTQRLASSSITPIGDFSHAGFAFTSARRETAFGVETRFGKYTSMVGRYQLENGINGTDSFAVLGLQNRLPITKEFSLELGFERGFHLNGPNKSFNSATVGFSWQPNEDFRATARYEFRDRNGSGNLFTAGAAGRLSEGITALSRIQWSKGAFGTQANSALDVTAALAIRPVNSDRQGLLFTYTHRSLTQQGLIAAAPTRDRIDSLSADGYRQLTKRLEVYGKFALRFNSNGQPDLPFASALTFLTQARAQYLLSRRIDWAIENRMLFQPSSATVRSIYATEAGFWALPDLRFAVGYNFTSAREPEGIMQSLPVRRGFYFTITSKLSNLFDLFGTSKAGLDGNQKPKTADHQ